VTACKLAGRYGLSKYSASAAPVLQEFLGGAGHVTIKFRFHGDSSSRLMTSFLLISAF